jgi:hypothetical protein
MHRARNFVKLLALVAALSDWAPSSGVTPLPAAIAAIQIATLPESLSLQVNAATVPAADQDRLEIGSPVTVSLQPDVDVLGATAAQEARLTEAIAKFTNLGLALPDLEVRFFARNTACAGHLGLFEADFRPWRISICSAMDFVHEHELAHAWEFANVTDQDRDDFMAKQGLERWNHAEDEWSERGVEMAAFIVQQGLLDRPVGSSSAEMQSRLEAFELLTGVPSPRFARA